jgi:hypothetical protein
VFPRVAEYSIISRILNTACTPEWLRIAPNTGYWIKQTFSYSVQQSSGGQHNILDTGYSKPFAIVYTRVAEDSIISWILDTANL